MALKSVKNWWKMWTLILKDVCTFTSQTLAQAGQPPPVWWKRSFSALGHQAYKIHESQDTELMSGREPLVRVSDVKTRLDCDTFASCRQFHLHLKYLIWFIRSSRHTHTHKCEHTHTAFSSVPEWSWGSSAWLAVMIQGQGGLFRKALFEAEETHGTGRNKEL